MKYSWTQFYDHQQQELNDSMKWHEATGHFETDRERMAFRAGFLQGSGKAVSMISLHGGYSLHDSKKAA